MSKSAIDKIIAQINKANGGEQIIGKVGDMENIEIERIPCGIAKVDEAVGGGFPLGRMVEFYGLPSAGKSLISQLIVAQAQKAGKECVWVDAEASFDPIFAKQLGVDVDNLTILQSAIGEDIIDVIAKLLEAEPGVIVIDSLAALITRPETEESVEKVFMAPKARMMSRGLPKLTALNKKTLIIFINQLRSVITTWGGGGSTTPGGRSLPHYASIRIEIKREKDLLFNGPKTSSDPVGQVVLFQVTKNKTGTPFKKGSFKFYFDGRTE